MCCVFIESWWAGRSYFVDKDAVDVGSKKEEKESKRNGGRRGREESKNNKLISTYFPNQLD